ncbi:MAG: AAA-like domain-containing protein [Candidatus Cloacimonetes bacterium]|nr:AAA-like domain-containing protein [Candidatus Cloacimonadota bacterium]
MNRKFNVTGLCVPKMHYMVNLDRKLDQIISMIEAGEYFTINRPRQFGKTTIINELETRLENENYVVISLSFEGIGDDVFKNEKDFIQSFIRQIEFSLKDQGKEELTQKLSRSRKNNFNDLNIFISDLVRKAKTDLILIIDEVDKSSNNQLFLSFLGMLRDNYLRRNKGKDVTFQSVILAGVHDVKTLKLKLRPDEEQKYNSPWNIASDFKVDLTFDPTEISTMLRDYSDTENVKMDIGQIAEKIHYFTSGHPFLVSKICKILDEELLVQTDKWELKDIESAVDFLIKSDNTNFDSLIKNIENDIELYDLIKIIIIDAEIINFVKTDNVISKAGIYGILRNENEICKIDNLIYEMLLSDHIAFKMWRENKLTSISRYNFQDNFIIQDKKLDFEKIILKFQEFMKNEYSAKDNKFLERNGRLIFLAFLKPIINGKGWDFKEVQISQEKRLDVVVTFLEQKYIVEMKKWYGEKYHQKGIDQLSDYLERQGLEKGYLIIFDFESKKKDWKQERISKNDKDIFAVWV